MSDIALHTDMSDNGGVVLDMSLSHVDDEGVETYGHDLEAYNLYHPVTIATTTTMEAALNELERYDRIPENMVEMGRNDQDQILVPSTDTNGEVLHDVETENTGINSTITDDMNHVTVHLQAMQGQQLGDDNGIMNMHDGAPITCNSSHLILPLYSITA